MPWLGFFNKINRADKWVVLNHTLNNPRDAAFWCRRVKVLINSSEKWLSLPLEKPEEPGTIGIPINKIKYSFAQPGIYNKLLYTLEISYKKAPYFNEVYPLIKDFFSSQEQMMEKRNLNFILSVMKRLNINTEIIFSDQLNCKESSTELLVEIIHKVNGDVYLCGDGASGYQDDELFKKNNIELRYNNFIQSEYKQFNTTTFIPGLSVIDALMNIGFKNTSNLLNMSPK